MLHELTTNAVKYGAWSGKGTVRVSWTERDGRVFITWQETGKATEGEPERRGFGSMLMNSAARQFGGSIEREFGTNGLVVEIDLPLDV